jgi:hypothetical protein
MLINDLRADASLAPYIRQTCCETDFCVDFDPAIPADDYLVVKVDDFYNAAVPNPDTPKSPDCLIVQRCAAGHFHVHVVELKNVKYQSDLDQEAIWDKFHTCLTDFMSDRFRSYFYKEDYDFKLQLYLVAGRVRPSYTMNFELDWLLSIRPLQFANKFYGVKPENPNPLIRPC